MATKPKKTHMDKKWGSLTDLRSSIEKSKVEKIKSFDGYELITNKGAYTLYDGELTLDTKKKK